MNEFSNDEPPYIVTLDDDSIICSLIENIVALKTFSFATATELLIKKSFLSPLGFFVDINLAQNECGLDVIPELRRIWPEAPIIVMTGDDYDSAITQALAAGAHDFILKPLRPVEVIARLNARRLELANRHEKKVIHFGDIIVDLQYKTTTGPKGQCFQSPREMEILTFLVQSSGLVVDKQSIKRHVWGSLNVSDNALDRKLFEVRKTIREVSNIVEMKAVYGKGIILKLTNYESDQILLQDKQVKLNQASMPTKGVCL